MPSSFSRQGVGLILANTFDKVVARRAGAFPDVERGRTLFLAADFGGHHRGQSFDTYSFLVLDLDRNGHWLQWQQRFRRSVMPRPRRMAFKAFNDGTRRRALVPFLQMAQGIEGFLVTFAVSKACGPRVSLFEADDEPTDSEEAVFREVWKPVVFERAMRVVHLSAFLLSGFSCPMQNLMWIIDEDEIASNVEQLTQLTNLFARVWSNCDAHNLGHIRCGTTKCDDGSLAIEDLVAIPDLVAGAIAEVGTSMIQQAKFPVRGLWTPTPSGVSWKTRTILSWLAYEACPLQRLTCYIELNPTAPGMRITQVRWDAIPGPIMPPSAQSSDQQRHHVF
jgi:hypothetical protein